MNEWTAIKKTKLIYAHKLKPSKAALDDILALYEPIVGVQRKKCFFFVNLTKNRSSNS